MNREQSNETTLFIIFNLKYIVVCKHNRQCFDRRKNGKNNFGKNSTLSVISHLLVMRAMILPIEDLLR